MRPILEVVLSLLAVVGLLSLSWLCFSHILAPLGGEETVSLVPGRGDGESLEQAVRGLLWLRGSGFFLGEVVIVDCGLTPSGRAVAAALCLQEPGMEVCSAEEAVERVKEKRE